MGSNFTVPVSAISVLNWIRARASGAIRTLTMPARANCFKEFRTMPGEGEPGVETWGFESWKNRTGNNVWAFALTVDEDRGIVYYPVSSPARIFMAAIGRGTICTVIRRSQSTSKPGR